MRIQFLIILIASANSYPDSSAAQVSRLQVSPLPKWKPGIPKSPGIFNFDIPGLSIDEVANGGTPHLLKEPVV